MTLTERVPRSERANTLAAAKRAKMVETEEKVIKPAGTLVAQFQTADGQVTGPAMAIPSDASPEQLALLLNTLLQNEEPLPYAFYVNQVPIQQSLQQDSQVSSEETVTIVYEPEAVFRVRAVTRCSSSLSGHAAAVLHVAFSPDGRSLASGSGDTTVRFWDLSTDLPLHTGKSHSNWVLVISWSPDGKWLASGSMDNTVQLWHPETGMKAGPPLRGHTKWITSIAWQPLHLTSDGVARLFASASKDATVRVWDAQKRVVLFALSQHTDAISCIRWSGRNQILTGSRDRSVRVWCGATGQLVHVLQGHAHWINTMTLSTDYVLRTGPFDHTHRQPENAAQALVWAKERYEAVSAQEEERLVTGSDDFTLFLWSPNKSKKPLARLTGHQALVNQVAFSPDGRLLASASFDKSVKLWNGFTGEFIASLRAHVGPVYQIAWSADSRLLCSASRDSTLKLWDVRTRQLRHDLPGHLDEVYAVDWSPAGDKVASGGKDMVLKIWRH